METREVRVKVLRLNAELLRQVLQPLLRGLPADFTITSVNGDWMVDGLECKVWSDEYPPVEAGTPPPRLTVFATYAGDNNGHGPSKLVALEVRDTEAVI